MGMEVMKKHSKGLIEDSSILQYISLQTLGNVATVMGIHSTRPKLMRSNSTDTWQDSWAWYKLLSVSYGSHTVRRCAEWQLQGRRIGARLRFLVLGSSSIYMIPHAFPNP